MTFYEDMSLTFNRPTYEQYCDHFDLEPSKEQTRAFYRTFVGHLIFMQKVMNDDGLKLTKK